MAQLICDVRGLEHDRNDGSETGYGLAQITKIAWDWDAVIKSGHPVNCWYNRDCLFNVYVKDGVVLREEQASPYPVGGSGAPDLNPRGCQKGVCYSNRMYDPSRLKYPLKRVGARGAGKWQRVTWDQALTEIADKLIAVLVADGPEAILDVHGPTGGSSNMVSGMALINSLGIPTYNSLVDQGDEHPGAALTWGKIVVACSSDNWFHADMVFIWGGNPAYTHTAQYHFIPEARYRGARVVAITPDYNPSAPFCDLWVPVKIGSDAALALAMAQVIIAKGLHKVDFIREQTDLPLLVRSDSSRFLTQKDLVHGGRDNVYFMMDQKSGRLVEAPRKTLALNGIVPALDGEYQVDTLQGRVRVRPVFQLLKEHLRDYTPEKAAAATGVSPALIERLAVEFATVQRVVNITSANWGKHYHGDLIQRAQILLWALCGHFGKEGSGYSAFPSLWLDTKLGYLMRRGTESLLTAKAGDPRLAAWLEDGYTDEMVLFEYQSEAAARGELSNLAITYHLHAGLLEMADKTGSGDPYLKRSVKEYLQEALDKGWQVAVPPSGKAPRIIMERGGNFLKRARTTGHIVNNLLPKIEMLVVADFRMSGTAFHADYVLPAAGWYERYSVTAGQPECPFLHLNNKVVDPLGESKPDWEMNILLARKMEERAQALGISSFRDRRGTERRLDNLYDQVTADGLYLENEGESVTRDYFLNATNIETVEWEEYKEKGIVPFTGVGAAIPDNACEVRPGKPIVSLTYHTRDKRPYPTMTRRMQFYIDHLWFLELGEALPTHKDVPMMGGGYPLQLTGGHARWSIHSCWKDSPILLRLQRGVPIMFMSSQDARSRGIVDGDRVQAFNDVASIEIEAAVSPAVKPGQVIIYHDWETFQFKGHGYFKDLMPSPLNPIELVGGYGHIRPRFWYGATPGANDRGVRLDVRKAHA